MSVSYGGYIPHKPENPVPIYAHFEVGYNDHGVILRIMVDDELSENEIRYIGYTE